MMKVALLALMLVPLGFAADIPTLWIIGDSTVRNGQGDGANKQWGWGDLLAPMFDRAKITVANRARGGTSTKTFMPLWANVLPQIKPGDFVIMQFGHNDSSPV